MTNIQSKRQRKKEQNVVAMNVVQHTRYNLLRAPPLWHTVCVWDRELSSSHAKLNYYKYQAKTEFETKSSHQFNQPTNQPTYVRTIAQFTLSHHPRLIAGDHHLTDRFHLGHSSFSLFFSVVVVSVFVFVFHLLIPFLTWPCTTIHWPFCLPFITLFWFDFLFHFSSLAFRINFNSFPSLFLSLFHTNTFHLRVRLYSSSSR